MLQFMGLQRIEHNLVTEQQQQPRENNGPVRDQKGGLFLQKRMDREGGFLLIHNLCNSLLHSTKDNIFDN